MGQTRWCTGTSGRSSELRPRMAYFSLSQTSKIKFKSSRCKGDRGSNTILRVRKGKAFHQQTTPLTKLFGAGGAEAIIHGNELFPDDMVGDRRLGWTATERVWVSIVGENS